MHWTQEIFAGLAMAVFLGGAVVSAAAQDAGSEDAASSAPASAVDLHYAEHGQGDPVVLIPGFTFSGEVFEKQIEALSANHRLIIVDPRSQGASPKTADGNNFPQHGHDLARLFDRLELDDVTLVGWSFGALSAWSYVEQYGLDRVKSMVIIDMPPVIMPADPEKDLWVQGSVDLLAGGYHTLLTPEGQRAFIGGYAQAVMVQRELSDAELDWILSLSLQMPIGAVSDLYASGVFSNYFDTAQTIDAQIPTLYVLAEHWAPIAEPYVETNFPNADISVMGGHMMFWEYPDKFNEVLSNFLNDL